MVIHWGRIRVRARTADCRGWVGTSTADTRRFRKLPARTLAQEAAEFYRFESQCEPCPRL